MKNNFHCEKCPYVDKFLDKECGMKCIVNESEKKEIDSNKEKTDE